MMWECCSVLPILLEEIKGGGDLLTAFQAQETVYDV